MANQTMSNITCIEQTISTGGQFDGTDPGTMPDTVAGVKIYPAAAAGGLFEFFPTGTIAPRAEDQNLKIMRIALDMTNLDAADVWYIRIASTNGDVIFYSDGPGDYFWEPNNERGLIIHPDESIKIYNGIASTGTLFARIMAEPELAHWNRRK